MKIRHPFSTIIDVGVTVALLTINAPVIAEPGDIIILRDVPAQRWDVNRHTGLPTAINPSPINETNGLIHTVANMGLEELTDQQFSAITSNAATGFLPLNRQFANTLTKEIEGHGGSGSVGSQIRAVQGITSGLGSSISGSVGAVTGNLGNDIRDALSGTFSGK